MATITSLFTRRDAANYRIFTLWILAAAALFAVTTVTIDANVVPPAAGWAATAGTVILMIVSLRAYMHFLREADELLRKVHLESLAFSFGIGIVTMIGYRLCERLGAPKLDISDPVLVMVVAWALGQWAGVRRYAGGDES